MALNADYRSPRIAGEQAARALRLELELGFSPIGGPQLWQLIREREVDLAFHNFGSDGGDGLYLWNGERGLIALNTDRKPTRLRFTAAHELGHHEMHRHSLESVILSDENLVEQNATQSDIETEANCFAAELLAPQTALRRELADRESETLEPVDIVRLMRTYGMSYVAMLWRLVNARVITMNDRQRLEEAGLGRVAHLERGLGFDEGALYAAPKESLPEDFVLSVLRIHREGAVDDSRAAELLRRDIPEVVTLSEEFAPAVESVDPEIDRLLGDARHSRRR